MNLTDEMIKEYCDAVGTDIGWPAFTSTTKDPAVAEMYGANTLCIITLKSDSFIHGRDISDISHMRDEEELLLSIGFMFQVKEVHIDPMKKEHRIYLQTTSDGRG
jgi:hypothetical protein